MKHWKCQLLLAVLGACIYTSHACQMDAVTNWPLLHHVDLWDNQTGIFFESGTTNIDQIASTTYGEGLRNGPYIETRLEDGVFTMFTRDNFPQYEENEVALSMGVSIVFTCSSDSGMDWVTFVVSINVQDTNNNRPQFRFKSNPTNSYELTIAPPLPPGFVITGCLSDLIVRDIDLTTLRINFTIQENPYFEIEFDAENTVDDTKEFRGIIRTTDLVRSLPEPLELTIWATDVDDTLDPPFTEAATIRIQGDVFELPAEPIFSRAFYTAEYTTTNEVILQESISLRQGYDEEVQFSLEEDQNDNFLLSRNGNVLTILVTTPLSSDALRTGQIVLAIRAERELTSGATTTVVIRLPEVTGLEFQQANYEGSIVDNSLEPLELQLSQGYEENAVSVTITSEHTSSFTPTIVGNLITLTMTPLAPSVIDANNFINLLVIASTDHSVASTVVTLEIVKDDNVTPAFERALYTGSYDQQTGLTLDTLALFQGFDDTVTFSLDGEHASFFQLSSPTSNGEVSLVSSVLPVAILSTQNVLLTVLAEKPRTVGASATVSIAMPPPRDLLFTQPIYAGTIEDSVISLTPIMLSSGYGDDVSWTISGNHENYFLLIQAEDQVTIGLAEPIPENVIAENNFFSFIVEATGEHATSASSTVLLEIMKQDITTPVFSQSIYNGLYTGTSELDIPTIRLLQGYDSTVSFTLYGEHAQYFTPNIDENSDITLSLVSQIPEDIIFNEKVLLFNIRAEKPLSVTSDAVIAIRFPTALTEPTQMRFSQNTYVGSLEDRLLDLNTITLESGYAPGTEFVLTGELSSYFTMTPTGNVVTITLSTQNVLPDEILENHRFISLDLEAQRERAVSTTASIIIDVLETVIEPPVFSEVFYRGVYTEETGLYINEEISLSDGYDETVSFTLEGEHATHFSIAPSGSSVTLSTIAPIPTTVLENNNQLLFTIAAIKPNTITARAAISIDLPKETPDTVVVRFAQSSYVGSIDINGQLQGPTMQVLEHIEPLQLDIVGEHSNNFAVNQEGTTITIQMVTALPEEVIDEDTFIILDIVASYPEAVSGYTTVILEIIKVPQIVTPVFEHAYYAGEYSEQDGLLFEHAIRLHEGFDNTVSFALQGDDSQWFELINNGENNLSVRLANGDFNVDARSPLVFSVVANKPNNVVGQAAIIISRTDLYYSTLLQFSQNYYTATIENNEITTIQEITLSEGYTSDVTFSLQGDLAIYFTHNAVGPDVTVTLQTSIPEASIPPSGIIVLELQASAPLTPSAFATIVFEVVRETSSDVELHFSDAYYTGSYTDAGGLVFDDTISLVHGYDETVQFNLEGDSAQWFGLARTANSLTLTLTASIPPAVVTNNNQLIFTIRAEREGSTTVRSTIIVLLPDELSSDLIIGFDRISYLGSIENDVSTLDTITLSEGYTSEVTFALRGDLAIYFTHNAVGPDVAVTLQTSIPEASIPPSGIIVLELQASAPLTPSAFATIVFEVVRETSSDVELHFSDAYYTGSYTDAGGLVFDDTISLVHGYDETVQFILEGDSAQWFGLARTANSLTLTLTASIPPAVVTNNNQLIFTVRAEREGSTTVRSTIIVLLPDELSSDPIIGFDRISYLGSIENDVSTLDTISLREGYTSDVTFALRGDLAIYFTHNAVGPDVTVTLQTSIPEASIPPSGIIVLELQASAPLTPSAFATIVFEVVRETSSDVELHFSDAYYTGSYTDAGGLVFDDTISLVHGYDETVQFNLEGDSAQWFGLARTANSLTLTLTASIPPAVVTNNNQLIFTIRAEREGFTSVRSTIIVLLPDELSSDLIIGFDRISYLGSIENDVSTLDTITLSEGYTSEVTFALRGDLAIYFTHNAVGPDVAVTLQTSIPEASIPPSGIIVLELQASAPLTPSAFATIVFEVVRETSSDVELHFSDAYYTGSYTDAGGLVFDDTISLVHGYDETVQFNLEGDSAQWFGLARTANSLTLTLTASIPPAVVTNNNQLIFTVRAEREGSTTVRSTIIVLLPDELSSDPIIGFDRISYLGSIENDVSTLDTISLREGYTSDVTFALRGDLAIYFTHNAVGPDVTVTLQTSIPEASIPPSGIIVLELQASAPLTPSAFATIVFEVVRETSSDVELHFSDAYYTGSYTDAGGLVFDDTISLVHGYDETVQFNLEGDSAQWFGLARTANSLTLTLTASIPPAVVTNNNQLIFTIRAEREGSTTVRSTIIVLLPDELSSDLIIGFDRISYLGSIENDVSTLDTITLSEGYTSEVTFALRGDLAIYFTHNAVGPDVAVTLQTSIPEASIPPSGIIVLELQASAPLTPSAFATIVFEVVRETSSDVELHFSDAYYTGSYTDAGGLVFDDTISLVHGYDETVQFNLEGDSAQWFGLARTANSLTLTLTASIPPAVVTNNNQLIFTVRAEREGSTTVRSTIIVLLPDELSSDPIIGFDRISYLGSIENDVSTLDTISLREGYTSDVTFALRGDLAIYFTHNAVGPDVTVTLQTSIPEASIPPSGIIVLELQASAPLTPSAFATIVFEVVRETSSDVELHFSDAYYTGSYTDAGGLVFDDTISLVHGYDETVQFNLEGDSAQWFGLARTANSLTLTLTASIPPAVVTNNNQLIFTVRAEREGSTTVRSTIIVLLPDELSSDPIIGFDRISYLGSIENDVSTLDTISLREGYTSDVTFALRGDLAIYFTHNAVGPDVTVTLQTSIPEASIPPSGIIVLELQASAPLTPSAFATIVFEVVRETSSDVELHFSDAYYTGSYTDAGGLVFDDTISLVHGYDETVQFNLEGDSAQWFGLARTANSLTLTLTASIPPAVVTNNNQLIFTIRAEREGSTTVRSTIIVLLPDELSSDLIIGFDRISYLGSIENDVSTLDTITLSEGYTSEVTFALRGDLAIYFTHNAVGPDVAVTLQTSIPEASIPPSGIIVLELQASAPLTPSAFATIVFEVVRETSSDVELHFSDAYYTGSYTDAGGLVFDDTISLVHGYDETVQFNLEGDSAQWFGLARTANSLTLTLTASIPPAVVTNNNQLIFTVRAEREGSTTVRSTIIVLLPDELSSDLIIGFDRISYLGSIENDVSTLDTITLSEGYTSDVTFALRGDLAIYFTHNAVGPDVTVTLQTSIPEASIPPSGIIVLELQASAPLTPSAFATIVFEVVRETSSDVELHFSDAYYSGSYTDAGGLVFDDTISLVHGYDETVQFNLEGDSAQWFGLARTANSLTLTLTASIPPAVVNNNNQLIFTVRAEREGSTTVRSTIIVLLPDELSSDLIIGFDRISYLGSIENDVSTLDTITLSEGYTSDVTFALRGDLAIYFTHNAVGPDVTVTLQTSIPEASIPPSGIIVLELQASAPLTPSAFATIVFEVVRETSSDVELHFSDAYYTGSYTDAGGLVFDDTIFLVHGYDETVQFNLEGDSAQWFGLARTANSLTLTLTASIPPAVVTNNNQLIFTVRAEREGSTTVRSTIIVLLPDELSSDLIIGFDRISYLGSIENDVSTLDTITLSEGYTSDVTFALRGDLAIYFTHYAIGPDVTVTLQTSIPEASIPPSGIIVLELQASAPLTPSAFATIVFEVVRETSSDVELHFSDAYYTGSYTDAGGLVFDDTISLVHGYDETVQFNLEGDSAQWFGLARTANSLTLTLTASIPPAVVTNNNQLIFTVRAEREGSTTVRSTIIVLLPDELSSDLIIGFDRISYLGSIENDVSTLDTITLSEGYTSDVTFALRGDLALFFTLYAVGPVVTVTLQTSIPEASIPPSGIIVLELQASAPLTPSAFATIVFEVVRETSSDVELHFSDAYYSGSYTDAGGLVFDDTISLVHGYDETVQFNLEGDSAQWFGLARTANSLTLTLTASIPPAVVNNNNQLIFTVRAEREGSTTVRSTIIVLLPDELSSDLIIGFDRISYLGSIENDVSTLDTITLSEGYTSDVTFALRGDLALFFTLYAVGPVVTVTLQTSIPEASIPPSGIIVLELQASAPLTPSAFATIVFEVVRETSSDVELHFSDAYYTGSYTDAGGLVFDNTISLVHGYDETVQFNLEGDSAQWFILGGAANSLTLTLTASIPPAVIAENHQLVFTISAQRTGSTTARAAIIIYLITDLPVITFDKFLYEGIIQSGDVSHETIRLSEDVHDVEILGVYATLFEATVTGSVVTVRRATGTVPAHEAVVALELRAAGAGAVLVLRVDHGESPAPDPPTVSFGSPTYALRTNVAHIGLLGRVEATADNGENVRYSLQLDNEHLLSRLSVDSEGALHLSAPANTGQYNFQVVATTVFTGASGAATVQLTVEAASVCGDDSLVVPPLIVLDRDEEQAHSNLVVLTEENQGCQYTLTNRWPVDQTWLYVDDRGLHARAIDREHESIAHMALSQVQVELMLECDGDTRSRQKRSSRLDWLGPYDYGNNKWVLTDSIEYNARRTLVNLIVNDINDNHPIFVGKENEPIIVGYPVPDLEERVLPRALVELQATDADIGENAALRYWSSELNLAVSPTTGSVHVRHHTQLEDETTLIISATDRNGGGLTGTIELMVKLLDVNHIAVVTVRNSYLDDEGTILADLSAALGYEVKALRSTIISDSDEPEQLTRKKRQATNAGATMQIYVYGLQESEPVEVDQLTADINNIGASLVSVASTVSLEDHLDALAICNTTGLLVSTIVLSVLLFILIVAAAVWFFLRWRKNRNYDHFSDANSIASRAESLGAPKPQGPTPRLNIEDLRKSEKRLQERLGAPIEEVTVEPSTSRRDQPVESVVNLMMPDPMMPIVIQTTDKLKDAEDNSEDEDEFGERIGTRRKSVVTFNENVEKIIHVEDTPEDDPVVDQEIFRL